MAKFEITVEAETVEAVKELVEARNARIAKLNEKREAGDKLERTSIAEMCGELVTTGAFRRKAANKWADENRAPAKPRAKKAAAPKAKKPAAKKEPKAKKPTIRKVKKAEAPAAAPAATGTDGANANGSPLD